MLSFFFFLYLNFNFICLSSACFCHMYFCAVEKTFSLLGKTVELNPKKLVYFVYFQPWYSGWMLLYCIDICLNIPFEGKVAEDSINVVWYWRLPSSLCLWAPFECQCHSSSCFFCYNCQSLQIPVCLHQATRIDAGSTSNFARIATDATKHKLCCKCKHFPTLSLAWLSLAWS